MALVTLKQVRTPAHRGQAFECDFWQLESGQKWFVVGGNGSGKTTMARVITGKQAISRGEISVAPNLNALRDFAIISFEQQQTLHALDDRFDDSELREDASDPGTLVSEFLGRSTKPSADYEQWLNTLDIKSLEDRGIRQLSTGEMRKVLLARAVLADAQVLILDDPLAGLDVQTQRRFSQLLDSVFAKLETVIVLSTSLSDIGPHFSHVAVLCDGRVSMAEAITDTSRSEAKSTLNTSKHSPANIIGGNWPAAVNESEQVPDTFIEMKDVSVSFGAQPIFAGLSWSMQRGDHALISGPNGCGKSTLLAMLSGENAKAYGQNIILFGKKKGSGESIWELRKYLGVVSTALQQKYAKGYKVIDVVLSGLQDSVGLYADTGGQQQEVAEQWLSIVGASKLAQNKFDSLSYGQQKMVLIARAMVKQPALLVLDEPCIGLDQENRKRVLRLVDEIATNSRTHLLFVSHVADERPACINQQLQFVWDDALQCYRIEVSRV